MRHTYMAVTCNPRVLWGDLEKDKDLHETLLNYKDSKESAISNEYCTK